MLKKSIIRLYIVFLAFSFFSGCIKKDEYGTIDEMLISTPEVEEKSELVFAAEENPLTEYTYENLNFECAKLSIPFPKGWRMSVYNQSLVRYDAPSDDPYIPSATCYLKCLYDFDASEDNLDSFAHHANEFGRPMSSYLTGLPFSAGGRDLWIKSYTVSDESYVPSFVQDESQACIKVTKNVMLINKKTGETSSFKGNVLTATFLRWEGFPVMIAMVTKSDYTTSARKLSEYMLSNISKIPHKIRQTKSYEYNSLRFTVPSEFYGTEGSGNVLRSKSEDIKSSSGMCVGIFKVEEDIDHLTLEYFQEHYAQPLATNLLESDVLKFYEVNAYSYEGRSPKLSDEKKVFGSNVNIIATTDDYIAARLPYGTVSVWLMDSFIVERGGAHFLVAALYPRNESDIAAETEKMVLQSFALL